MSIFNVGRVCVKLAGRDAGKKCVVVEHVDDTFVVIDGATRRRKVNVRHLEPLDQVLEISDKASHDVVKAAFEKLGVKVVDTKPKQAAARPRKAKKRRAKEAPAAKESKKEKKSSKKETEKKAESAAENKE